MKQAVCTFCGADDPSVQVICDGRCLICSSCQKLSSIGRLLRDSYFSSNAFEKERPITDSFEVGSDSLLDVGTRGGGGGAGVKGGCPICGEKLSQSMVQTIIILCKQGAKESNGIVEDYTARHVGEVDIGLQSNWFNTFIKRYKSVYEEGNKDYHEEEAAADPERVDNNDESDNSTLKTRPSTAVTLKGASNKLAVKKVDIYAVGPPKLNANGAITFGIDCLCHQWQSLQSNHTESFVHMAMKRCSRKKASQRTNDFKAKSVVDFFSAPSNIKSPVLLLLAKLLAFHPKRADLVRPAWGIVTVAVMVLVNFEKCMRDGKLFLAAGVPATSELRKKIEGKDRLGFNDKIMPLKRAIKVIEFLLVTNQVHWNMTPYTAGCVEYSAHLPWTDASISKLLHLLFYAIDVGDEVVERGGRPVCPPVVGSGSQEHSRPATTDRGGRPRNGDKARSAKSPPPSRGAGFGHGHSRIDPAVEQRTAEQLRRLASLPRRAQQLWRSRVRRVADRDLAAAGSAIEALHMLAPGRVSDGSITSISLQAVYAGGTGMTVQLSVLCLVMVEAWEREHLDLQASLERASVTRERKPAFSGYLDGAEIAPFTKLETLGLTRIVDFYATNLQQSSDLNWDEVKALAAARKYPFSVPRELLLKSNAELNYHFTEIGFERSQRKLRENVEDMLAAGGPYSQSVLQAALLEGEGAFGLRESHRDSAARVLLGRSGYSREESADSAALVLPTPQQRDAISRGQYLASQTLGEGESGGSLDGERAGVGSRPATSLNPSSYPLRSAPAIPLSATPVRDADRLQMAISGGLLLEQDDGDSRPTLLAYMQGDAEALLQSCESAEEAHFVRDAAHVLSMEQEMSASASQKYRGLVERQVSAGYVHGVATPSEGVQRPEVNFALYPTTRNGALAKLPYQSPSPGRHGLNIVDVIAMRASTARCLSKVNLLDEQPLASLLKSRSPSSTGMAHSASLDDDLFGFMDRLSFGFSPAHSALRPSTSANTIGNSSQGTAMSGVSLIGSVVDAIILDAADNNSQSRGARASPLKAAKMRIKNRMSVPYEEAILKESARESDALAAKRYYDNSEEDVQTTVAKGIAGLGPSPAGPAGETGGIKMVLTINCYVGAAFGNVESRRSQDILVEALALEDSELTPRDFELACQRYLGSSDEQLETLRKIQICHNSRLNASSAEVLGSYFRRKFNLVHLDVSNNNFGDIGCSKMLAGIVASGGALQLRRLEIRGTNVALAVSGMAILSEFKELRALDISCNCITLDIAMSKRIVVGILESLTQVETLSLAYNRIRDDGLNLISGALKSLRLLKVLDLANTFITKVSLPMLEHFLREAAEAERGGDDNTNQKLQVLLLQGHLFTAESLVEIRYQLGVRRVIDVVLDGPYSSMCLRYPLRYQIP